MKRKAWQRGVVRAAGYPLLWGVSYTTVYTWDEPIGFRLRFGWGSYFAEYSSKGTR